jgi:hypothetical protein
VRPIPMISHRILWAAAGLADIVQDIVPDGGSSIPPSINPILKR